MAKKRTVLEKIEKIFRQDGQKVAIIIALAIYLTLLVYGFFTFYYRRQEYISFYLLDYEKTANNFPELLVIGKNNTFQLWAVVENHMAKNLSCMVLLKITDLDSIGTIPVQKEANASYEKKILSGETWEIPMNITINKTGNFSCVFELWIFDEKTRTYEFSKKFCILTLEVKKEVNNDY